MNDETTLASLSLAGRARSSSPSSLVCPPCARALILRLHSTDRSVDRDGALSHRHGVAERKKEKDEKKDFNEPPPLPGKNKPPPHHTDTHAPTHTTRAYDTQAGHPFDVILQKVPASSPHKKSWDERVQQYADDFPEAYVVDLPAAVRQIANRDTMLDAVVRVGDGGHNLNQPGAEGTEGIDGAAGGAGGAAGGAAGGDADAAAGVGGGGGALKVRAPRQIVAVAGTEEEVRRQARSSVHVHSKP